MIDFREVGIRGSDDEAIMTLAAQEDAVVLTTDRDFFHTLGREPGHPGLVVVALKQPTREKILARLTWLIERVGEDHLRGRAIQLRDRAWQAYPPLDEG
ncbi:putative nuclease of putative toxin-antitoxin system [Phycisphaera mikurensis]|nr:putative nuclease of putative toxin-antitoxin system [Phycisphaera mikurensis]